MIAADPKMADNNACPWSGMKEAYQGWWCKNPDSGEMQMLVELRTFYGSNTDFEGCVYVVDPCTDGNFRVEGGVWR